MGTVLTLTGLLLVVEWLFSEAIWAPKQGTVLWQAVTVLFPIQWLIILFLALGKSLNPLSVSSSVKYIMDIYQSHQDWLFNIYKVPKGLEA